MGARVGAVDGFWSRARRLLILVVFLSACSASDGVDLVDANPAEEVTATAAVPTQTAATPVPAAAPEPSAPTPDSAPSEVGSPTDSRATATPLRGRVSPDLILHNAAVVTVDADFSVEQAVAVTNGVITAVGASTDLLTSAGPDTLTVDLEGRAVLPGFVETHTHLMQAVAPDIDAMMAGHDDLISQGITTAGMPSVLPDQLEAFEKLDANGLIELRAHLYVAYNSVCGDRDLGDFYLQNPFTRDPNLRLALAGVKIFTDGGVCGGPAMSIPYLDSTPEELYNNGWVDNGDLFVTDTEITRVLQEVDAAGGQTVIHAIGDLAIATALKGVQKAGDLTHPRQIHHLSWASLVDTKLLEVFGTAGLTPVMQMMPWARACEPGRTELWQSIIDPRALAVVEDRVGIIAANPGIRFAWHGDGPSIIGSPLQQMFSIVSQGSTDGNEVCYPPQWASFPTVSVEDAIRMTTINAAAAMGYEDNFGSIEVGKVADLVVLEENPLSADPEIGLARNRPLATIIDGEVSYCRSALCGALTGQKEAEPPAATRECVALDETIGEFPFGKGLIGWWPAEGDGTDVVGTNDAVSVDQAGFDAGVVGQAFAPSGGAFALSNPVDLDQGFTLEGWVLFDDATFDEFHSLFNTGHVFLRKNNAAEGNGLAVFVELGDLALEPRAQSVSRIDSATWTHVAATWDGTTLALYKDGIFEGQSVRAGELSTNTVTAQIGRGEYVGTDAPSLAGRVDEFAIFVRSLAPQEIAAIFEAGSNGKCAP